MSSILTNNGAMVALQTLKSVNMNLGQTQNAISTGKNVATAKDNSAVWAISKVMESDVKGFKAIKDSLSLGESTVAVARNAAETVTDLLTQMKGKIVAAQEDNVDRNKINADVTALKDQISAVVGAAQFNGLNLVDGTAASASVLSSLDRDNAGNVTASSITVTGQNLSTGGYTAKAVFDATNTDGVSADGQDTFGFSLDANGGTDDNGQIEFEPQGTAAYAAGDSFTIRLGDTEVNYTVTAEDIASTSQADVIAVGMKAAIEASGANVTVDYNAANSGRLVITNDGTDSLQVSGQFSNANSGGLGALAAIDVSNSAGAAAALGSIETLIDTSIDAAAAFGSVQGRIETQKTFISNLTDSLKSGIGSMVDADMEEVSARLQALQVQQQLAVQSLSIANQAPQSILSLFR
ncbi:flagellin [Ruegeria pomeroyi]|uniref:Flagellin n=2 Tax=Ruegeria pomeroyi TaxID=89184 RepID=Q5LMV3_RUEPO|nr:flagellin [Ruegeria pomeroyi]HCE69814.1 flagellin [Ruegeria sp.]AAV96685.1 flagellin protein [Ruegeria pomeroyi DSS-3]NVK98731.1 flagellin [Ruegeria pomeroyi]NVL02608.1 flagellin [Ruegeria pomeroyi]QWV10223.1 flagellin [Ruegeria pomeroyi]